RRQALMRLYRRKGAAFPAQTGLSMDQEAQNMPDIGGIGAVIDGIVAALAADVGARAGAGAAGPDHDVGDAAEPEAGMDGLDAAIAGAVIDDGPAGLLRRLEVAPEEGGGGILRAESETFLGLEQIAIAIVQHLAEALGLAPDGAGRRDVKQGSGD